jgi:hypothetical protein
LNTKINKNEEKNTEESKAIFKFDNGNGALLCSTCKKVIKTGREFNEEEANAFDNRGSLPAQYCSNCKDDRS